MRDKINKVLFHWGLQGSDIKQIYDTAWQVGEGYVLKVYQKPGMLERNLKILCLLDEMHIPVGKIVTTYDNAQYASSDGGLYFLSEKLSGSNIVQIDNGSKIALMMGKIIAELHIAFQKCDAVEGLWDNSLLEEMNGWVKRNFEKNYWNRITMEEYEEMVSRLASVYDELPVQLIHRDVHFGNFLFTDSKFSGYIDFDLSQRNIRIFDICYFLLGLLSEGEKLNVTEEVWFEFVKNAFAGYESAVQLSEAERKAVPCVMECIELLFVSWFDGMNDSCCADDAFRIFEFVKEQEGRIRACLNIRTVL